jgi:hypothetical protein
MESLTNVIPIVEHALATLQSLERAGETLVATHTDCLAVVQV